VFTVMEPRNFIDMLHMKFPQLFVAMVENMPLAKIAAWLLR
jgi:hypothetical protein